MRRAIGTANAAVSAVKRYMLEDRVRRRLAEWEAAGLLRVLRPPAGFDFSSNDYLNLSTHPLIVDRLARAVRREGCGSTGSRLLRGDRDVFAAVERRFADFKGTERSLYFSSGYLANIARDDDDDRAGRRGVFGREEPRQPDRRHPAVGGDPRRVSAQRCAPLWRASRGTTPADRPPLRRGGIALQHGRRLRAARRVRGALPVGRRVAHRGRSPRRRHLRRTAEAGSIEAAGVGDDVLVSINTAGKALGVSGAFVAGPRWAIDYLIQRARPFVFSTAAPPALADALDASLDVIAAEPERRRAAGIARRVAFATQLARAGIAGTGRRVADYSGRDRGQRPGGRGGARAAGGRVRRPRHSTADRAAGHGAPSRLGERGAVGRDHRSLRRFARGGAQGGRALLRGIFVTGTDTNVGKTVVSAALLHRYRDLPLKYWKPIQTGIEQDDDTAEVQRLSACGPERVLDAGRPPAASRVASSRREAERVVHRASNRSSPSLERTVGRRLDRRGRGRRARSAERARLADRSDSRAWNCRC